MHYQDQHINIDVANVVRGQPTEDGLLRKLNCMGVNKDPNANVALPTGYNEQIAALPDVAALEAECRRLTASLKDKYDLIRNAPGSDPLVENRKEAQRKHRAKKEYYRARMKAELRKEYFVRKDDAIIEAQMTEDSKSPSTRQLGMLRSN